MIGAWHGAEEIAGPDGHGVVDLANIAFHHPALFFAAVAMAGILRSRLHAYEGSDGIGGRIEGKDLVLNPGCFVLAPLAIATFENVEAGYGFSESAEEPGFGFRLGDALQKLIAQCGARLFEWSRKDEPCGCLFERS